MEYGLFLVTQYDLERDLGGIGAELVTQTDLARDGGFDLVAVGEHHVTDSHQYLSNEAILAHLAEHVGEMRLAALLSLLPLHNPVRIAEFGATMDVLSGGRFVLGVGLGYRDTEYDAFDVSRAGAPGRLVEGVEVIKRLWSKESVTYDGEHFEFKDVSIRPQPVQEPRPPIWVGASNESSVRRGARIADAFIGAHVPFALAKRQIDDFRDERATQGSGPGEVGLLREAFVAESTEKAEALVRDSLMDKYASYGEWGQDDVIGGDDFDSPWEKLRHERFLVGSPEDVRSEVERYREAMDLDYLLARTQFPGLPSEAVHDSIRLFGEEVVAAGSE